MSRTEKKYLYDIAESIQIIFDTGLSYKTYGFTNPMPWCDHSVVDLVIFRPSGYQYGIALRSWVRRGPQRGPISVAPMCREASNDPRVGRTMPLLFT